MIVDLASYYEESKKDFPESPVKAAFKHGAKGLMLREMRSDAGLTESVIYGLSSESVAPVFGAPNGFP